MGLTRKQVIENLQDLKETGVFPYTKKDGSVVTEECIDYAISSLKTDEAYQLEYESRDCVEVIRCKDCKWFGEIGCAILIVDDSDKPTEKDFCSFAEKREQEKSMLWTEDQMKDNEALVLLSEYPDEWYQTIYTCSYCGCEFMTDKEHLKFCPGCGKKIIGEKQEKTIVYNLKGEK